MYTVRDFKTKKAVREAINSGDKVEVYQPGPFEGQTTGTISIEGPHYPKPHTWYSRVKIKDGVIIKFIQ